MLRHYAFIVFITFISTSIIQANGIQHLLKAGKNTFETPKLQSLANKNKAAYRETTSKKDPMINGFEDLFKGDLF